MPTPSSARPNQTDSSTAQWLSSALPQIEKPGHQTEKGLNAIREETASPYTRYVLYYGIDAVVIGTAAHLALQLLEARTEPSRHTSFSNLFKSSTNGALIELANFTDSNLYFPNAASRLSTAGMLEFTPKDAPPSRQIRILNPDYVNVFYGRPAENVTPTLLLRQTWTLADFDDQTRAATLLIAAAQIWSAATEKFAKNSKAQSNPVTDAVAKLLAYYSKYMQAISPESSVSKTAIALGTAYIEEARLKDVPRKYSLPGLTDAQLNLQLAAFGTFSAVPGKLVAPPETKKDLPQRPPVKASLPKSTSDHAPTERGPAEVKATVARRAQSTSQPPAAATTATESASPAAKKYVITRESGSSVSTLRDALFNAHNKGESGSITLFSGSKYSGQVVYGTMRLETVGLMDLSKGEKFNIPLKDIQKLELPGAGS